MSTLHSRKPLLALSALGIVAILFAAIVAGLSSMATWAERDLHAFPFKSEDWLRYLVPSRFENMDRDRLMLAGPSTVRENLRYDQFEAAFAGYDVLQGGISLGTIEDVTAALEYVETVYGAESLPDAMVLGISLRFIANIPDHRPFSLGLNLYSPHFSAVQAPTHIALEPKGPLDSLAARARFLFTKQPERFRTALMALFTHWLSSGTSAPGQERALVQWADRLLTLHPVTGLAERLGYGQIQNYSLLELLRYLISPYKYSLNPAIPMKRDPDFKRDDFDPEVDTSWAPTYFWDVREAEAETRARVRRFVEFVRRHGIATLVVNLPEREFSRVVYDPDSYQDFLQVLREELGGIEFVNLWEFLDEPDFHDREHTTVPGSIKLTDEIVRLVRQTILRPAQKAGGEARPPGTHRKPGM